MRKFRVIAVIASVFVIAGCGGGGGGGSTATAPAAPATTLTHAESKPASQKSVAMSRNIITVMGVESAGLSASGGRAAGKAALNRQANGTVTYNNTAEADTGCTLNGSITFTPTTSTVSAISGTVTKTTCTSSYLDGSYTYSGTVTTQTSTTALFNATITFRQTSTSLTMVVTQNGTYVTTTDTYTPAANDSITISGTDPKSYIYNNFVLTSNGAGGFSISGTVTDSSGVAVTYANSSCDSSANYTLRFSTNSGISGVISMTSAGSGSATITQTSNGAAVLSATWSASGSGTVTYADGGAEAFSECAYGCCGNSSCSGATPYCSNACTSASVCVQCAANSQCQSGYVCSSNQCVQVAASLNFTAADAVFDSARSKVYVSDKTNKKLYTLSLPSLQTLSSITFTNMPERMEMSADGSKLYVALLTREHSYNWSDPRTGYIAEINLATGEKIREILIDEDPYDLAVTSGGKLVVSGGSDQWTYIKTYNVSDGVKTGSAGIRQMSRISLHPAEQWIYAANTDTSPSDIEKFDISGTGITAVKDSPYHGDYRMNGNVYVIPDGTKLITRGGDVFNSTASATTDMTYIKTMTATNLEHLAFDAAAGRIYSVEGSYLRYYNLSTQALLGGYTLDAPASFTGVVGDYVFVVKVKTSTTEIEKIAKTALP